MIPFQWSNWLGLLVENAQPLRTDKCLGHANEEMSLLYRWHGLTVINDCYDKQTSANQDESGESDSLKITGVGKY